MIVSEKFVQLRLKLDFTTPPIIVVLAALATQEVPPVCDLPVCSNYRDTAPREMPNFCLSAFGSSRSAPTGSSLKRTSTRLFPDPTGRRYCKTGPYCAAQCSLWKLDINNGSKG